MKVKKLVNRLQPSIDEAEFSELTMIELECTNTIEFTCKRQKVNQFTAGEIYIATVLRTGTHEIDNDAGGLARFNEEQIYQNFRRIG